ncbi:hypothetical protein ABMA27_001182 [Loxostege sticticalis]|uniref:FP protein C-terminal domain-containing protein n=1 Tax=Loxostege sticticalis TaxID=481309 RepID=A0ABR3HXQ8_LOXSC
MNCAECNAEFNDGVQCGSCARYLDFACANISEAGYRKLGADRRALWKCPSCKISSPHVSKPTPTPAPETVTMDVILGEIRDIKIRLAPLSQLMADVASIKNEITELKAFCEFSSSKLDDFAVRLDDVESKLPIVQRIQESVAATENAISQVKKEFSSNEQWARLNNVEIKGVPMKKNENLFSIIDSIGRRVNYVVPKAQINYVSRIPTHSSKDKSIILSFINRYIKEEFVAAARAEKNLTADGIGYAGNPQRVFVNDHLTSENKKLLTKVKTALKAKDYRYIWVKYGKIHVRKNDNSHVLVINAETDLNRLV